MCYSVVEKDELKIRFFRYCGEYYDSEIEQIYLRARYYDPSLGRFTQQDPAMADGNNWYVYCSNNPINYKDPTGYWEEGDENLPVWAQAVISYYTTEWITANEKNDSETMAFAHQQAESARTAVADGYVPGIILDVPVISQKPYEYRCTPTAGAMVDAFYHPNDSMDSSTITQEVYNSLGIDVDRRPGLWPEEMVGIVDYSISKYDTNLPFYPFPGYHSITGEINNGNPIIFVVLWSNGGGHSMVITGYVTINGVNGVIYNDPWTGEQNFLPYSEMSSEDGVEQSYNTGTWSYSYPTNQN